MTAAQILTGVQKISWRLGECLPQGDPLLGKPRPQLLQHHPATTDALRQAAGAGGLQQTLPLPGGLAWYALHGAVYKDRQNLEWLQMSSSATVYHYEGKVNKSKHAEPS